MRTLVMTVLALIGGFVVGIVLFDRGPGIESLPFVLAIACAVAAPIADTAAVLSRDGRDDATPSGSSVRNTADDGFSTHKQGSYQITGIHDDWRRQQPGKTLPVPSATEDEKDTE